MTTPQLSLVIPIHDEQDNIALLLAELRDVLAQTGESYEILLVDDGSLDASWEVIQRAASSDAAVTGLRLSRNFGKESALAAGIEHARGAAVIVMDADLQHPPALIPQMVEIWRSGRAQVVEARKARPVMAAPGQRWAARCFYALFGRLSGFDMPDATDFKLLDRRVVEAWLGLRERGLFFRGMAAWLGFTRVQLPFAVSERRHGSSRWSLLRLIGLALTALTAFSAAPLRLITFAGGLFALFSLGLGVQTLYRKLAGSAVDGFTTVILLQLITGSLIMLGLGIIGEYLARIYDETKARPRYIVQDLARRPAAPDPQ